MKKISCSLFLASVVVLLCYAQPATALQQEKAATGLTNISFSPDKEWSEEESEEIAENFLRDSPTFICRGIEDSLKLINTAYMDETFSWQFNYEFDCWCPGYGWLGGEPTPQSVTTHLARIVVQEEEVLYAVLDDEWDILTAMSTGNTFSPPTDLAEGNQVKVDFLETCEHNIVADSFTNAEVTAVRRWRISHISNTADKTGKAVRGLKIALDSDLVFDSAVGFGTNLIRNGPPTYEWFYDELVEEPEFKGHPFDASVVLIHGEKATFTPGFDVSRSFDKTLFTTPDTQTVTVTFTKREETFDRVMISVVTEADADLVDAVIVGHSEEWYNEHLSDERYAEFGITNRGIPVELDIPLTVEVIIQVNPLVPEVVYRPHVHVSPHYIGGKSDSGAVKGSSFSFTNEAGIWTVSAEGDYVWNWSTNASSPPQGSVNLISSRDYPRQEPKKSSSILYCIVAAVIVIVGLVTFFFIRKRGKRTTQ